MENYNLSGRLIRAIANRRNLSTSTERPEVKRFKARFNTSISHIQDLIDQGADVNWRNDYGDVPLNCACRNSDAQCIRLLLQNGARVNSSVRGQTPLHILTYKDVKGDFARVNNLESVKLLIQHGVDVNVCARNNETPLYWAVRNNNIDCVQLLLQHGANVNVCSSINETPLHSATFNNNIECVELLVQHGAKIDVLDDNHDTPLNLAACDCHLEIIKILLDYNANVNNKNVRGQTPLMQAAIATSKLNTEINMACLELLIQASGQFDLRDENGELIPAIISYCDDDSKREFSELLLLPYCVNPRFLQALCRYQIRSSLHQQFLPDVIPLLNLPKVLDKFVLLL